MSDSAPALLRDGWCTLTKEAATSSPVESGHFRLRDRCQFCDDELVVEGPIGVPPMLVRIESTCAACGRPYILEGYLP